MNASAKEVKSKTPVEVVAMSDGRNVEFAGKRKLLKEDLFDAEGHWTGTRFDLRDGQTFTYDAPAADVKTPDGIYLRDKFAGHGSLQKIGDETAGAKTISDMGDAIAECIDRLNKGEWFVEGVGEGAGGTSVLLRALIEFTGKTRETLGPWLKAKTPAQKTAMRKSKELKSIVERIEEEDSAKTAHVDTDALFNELDSAA